MLAGPLIERVRLSLLVDGCGGEGKGGEVLDIKLGMRLVVRY